MVGGAVGYAAEGERRTIFSPQRTPRRLIGIMPMHCTQWAFSVRRSTLFFRVECQSCGRSWRMESACRHHAFVRDAIDKAIQNMLGSWHRECRADQISPDDEAWLREALK